MAREKPVKLTGAHTKVAAKTSALQNKAEQTRSPARTYAEELFLELGYKRMNIASHITMAGIKGAEAFVRKADSQYGGDLEKVDDVCRLMIELDDAKGFVALNKLFGNNMQTQNFNQKMQNRGKGFTHKKLPKNYVCNPKRWGWMGFQLKMQTQLSNGQKSKFEVQIIHKGMKEAYDKTHKLYEQVRTKLEEWEASGKNIHDVLSPDEIAIVEEILAIHKEAAEKCGMDQFYDEFPVLEDPPPMVQEDDIADIVPDEDPNLLQLNAQPASATSIAPIADDAPDTSDAAPA
jgi:hypothetical protein